jgi:hypothetical protein
VKILLSECLKCLEQGKGRKGFFSLGQFGVGILKKGYDIFQGQLLFKASATIQVGPIKKETAARCKASITPYPSGQLIQIFLAGPGRVLNFYGY